MPIHTTKSASILRLVTLSFSLFVAAFAFAVDGVRVGAWNMRWFPSGYPITDSSKRDPQREYKRIDSAARFIAREKVDILCMEEMRDRRTCEMLVTNDALNGFMVNACSEFTAAPEATVPAHQNAIISRFKEIDSGYREWSYSRKYKVRPPRGFVYAVFDISGSLVGVIGIHLKSNYIPKDDPNAANAPKINRTMREESSRQLLKFTKELMAKDYDGRKVETIMIAGDFNTSIFDKNYDKETTITALKKKGFKDCFEGVPERNTMPESKYYPATCFDYLFIKGSSEFFAPVVSKKQYTSDHKMISVVVRPQDNKTSKNKKEK